MRWFITYGDCKFEEAKVKILSQAKSTKEFDKVVAYNDMDVSEELRVSEVFKVPRGGGLWSWKPDIIWKTMQEANNGDIIVYCDSGCSVQKTSEWKKYWKILEKHDIIAQRIRKRTDKWTRKEVISFFSSNGKYWTKCYQYQATIIIVVSDFTREFIKEWRDLTLTYPEFVMDVTAEERPLQHKCLKENRHDQAIYSALIYKYLHDKRTKEKIFTQWEHIEDFDIFSKQAIRATRLRHGEEEILKIKFKRIYKRLIKDFFLNPFVYGPIQWYYGGEYR